MVVDFPFDEHKVGPNLFVRTFDPSTDPYEFVWHRDREDRFIRVLEGGGWKFQFEDDLPFELEKEDHVYITTGVYHRVIPGDSVLEILVEKL